MPMSQLRYEYSIPVYRVSLVRDGSHRTPVPQIRSSRDAHQVFQQYLEGVDRENFVVMLVDQKHKIIGIHTVATGSLTAAVVHPREVMKPAILSNAAAIIVAHNHPSGDPQPSQEDRALTAKLFQAGKILGIALLDHIILGDGADTYFSFGDEGLLIVAA